MTYDPKFTQKEMYDQYGRSRNTTKKADPKPSRSSGFGGMGPDPAERFGGSPTRGIGAKPVSKPFERGSSYDEVPTPTPSKPEDPSNIEKVKNKFIDLMKSFGADEPKEVKVDGKAVYKGPMFTNTPIDLDAQMARINNAVDYSKAPPIYYGGIPSEGNMRYDVVPSPTVNPNLQRNAINRIIKNLSPNSKEYTIKRGDTLSEIAQKEGVSVADLAKVNKIDNVDLIIEGETIVIPKPQEIERVKDFVDSVDPDAQFSQSGVPMDQRIFEPELGYDEITLPSEAKVDKKIKGLGARPEVTVTELDPASDTGKGLGSFEAIKTGMDEADPSLVGGMTFGKIKKDFVDGYLTGHEGVKAHKSLEGGKDTAAYGIKEPYDLDRSNYKTDKDFAAAVALKHYEETERKFKEPILDEYGKNTKLNNSVWEDLGEAGRYALTDLHFNTGTVGDSSNASDAKDAITNTLNFVIMTAKDKTKVSLVSLAERRAENWNKAADDLDLTKIDKIQQMPRAGGGTIMNYLDSEGNVVHRVSTSRIPVILNKNGTYKVLTTTREIDIK